MLAWRCGGVSRTERGVRRIATTITISERAITVRIERCGSQSAGLIVVARARGGVRALRCATALSRLLTERSPEARRAIAITQIIILGDGPALLVRIRRPSGDARGSVGTRSAETRTAVAKYRNTAVNDRIRIRRYGIGA